MIYSTYLSPLGKIFMAASGTSLAGLWFQDQKHFPSIPEDAAFSKELPVFTDTCRWLDLYFTGKIPDFTPELAFSGTEFQKNVWKILIAIPYGKTITYGDIASTLVKEQHLERMSARAVGGAVGKNPISIIVPCHRVVGAKGKLTGYDGGIERKAALLEIEKNSRR